MKRILPVLLALVAGCVSVPRPGRGDEAPREDSPSEREAKAEVRSAFDRLHRSWLDGDAMASLQLMSVQGISDWVLERSRDKSDGEFSRRIKALDAARKVDFDQWVRDNKSVRVPFVDERAVRLPESVLTSQWLVDSWKRYVDLEKATLAAIAAELEVAEVYVEGIGASVFVRAGKSPAMMYAMVQESGRWKFDYDVRPAAKVK